MEYSITAALSQFKITARLRLGESWAKILLHSTEFEQFLTPTEYG